MSTLIRSFPVHHCHVTTCQDITSEVSYYNTFLQDFGSIYSTLLPGAKAKLAPPEGQTVLDGLEVKVGFGDVWKDSLSELSGGQR